jgi:hypothetical protein
VTISFRAANGNLYTRELFEDWVGEGAPYTLKPRDHRGAKSLYLLYMETEDPTEYQFAVRYLEGWQHWERISKLAWMKDLVAQWRIELAAKLRSRALQELKDLAQSGTKEAFQANKWLLEKNVVGPQPDEKVRRGRPTKHDIAKEADRIASSTKEINKDYDLLIVQEPNEVQERPN